MNPTAIRRPPSPPPGAATLVVLVAALASCFDGTAPPVNLPVVTGQVLAFDGSQNGERAAQAFEAGDTVSALIDARLTALAGVWGHSKIRWVGLHITEPGEWRDSVAVPDSLAAGLRAVLSVILPPSFAGVLEMRGFVRNATGQVVEIPLSRHPVSVYHTLARAVQTAPLDARPQDVQLDARRRVLYLAQPEKSQVSVLSLDGMTFEPPITFDTRITGISLTAGGDSLLVVLRDQRQLAVVDVRRRPWDPARIDLTMPESDRPLWPQFIAVAANNKALISLTWEGLGLAGKIMELDLATGAHRDRSVDMGHRVSERAWMVSSRDRTRLVALVACCPIEGRVYDSATDTFLPLGKSGSEYGEVTTLDATGQRILVGETVADAQLTPQWRFYAPAEMRMGGISLDGRTVYFRGATGLRTSLLRIDAESGVVIEKIMLRSVPIRVMPGSVDSELVSIASNEVALIDLNSPVQILPPDRALARGADSAPAPQLVEALLSRELGTPMRRGMPDGTPLSRHPRRD